MTIRALSLGMLLALAPLSGAAEDEVGRRLLLGNTLADAEQAVKHYEARVAAEPESFAARLGAARALNQVIGIRTNGNLPLFDGLQDSAENKAIWAELAPRALTHARKAHAIRPSSVDAAAILATSYMFYAASQGIVSSILGGNAGEFQTNAQRVIDLDASHDAGLGHTLLAGFYNVAPWPVGDAELALEHYEKALALAPDSVRNQYGLGVYWAREDEPARARPYFERAIAKPCTASHSEKLLCDFIKQESTRALGALR